MMGWVDDAAALERLLHPFSVDVFLREYFNAKALFVAGEPQKFAGLIDPERILHDAKWGPLSRSKTTRAGFRDAAGEHREISIRTNEIDEALAAGMTVLVPNLPVAYPEIAAFVRRMRTALLIPDKMAVDCFVSPPGSGYGLHYDPCSIWVVQLAGTKVWRAGATPVEHFPKRARVATGGEAAATLADPSALTTHRLCPGDLLYLPPATWHDVRAETLSVHLSVTQFYRPLSEIFTDLLRVRLDGRPNWGCQPVHPGASTPAETREEQQALLGVRLEEFKREVAALDVAALVESLRARIDTAEVVDEGPPRPDVDSPKLEPDVRLAYDVATFEYALDPARDADEALCLYHRGRLFATLPRAALSAIAEMRRRVRFSGAEILAVETGFDWEELRRLLDHMLHVGALEHL